MPQSNSSAAEIEQKLREDFRRRLREFGITAEATDPVLAVLFRTFARQLEILYSDTERIRLALLDELIGGLGISKRTAHPAQTIVRFAIKNAIAGAVATPYPKPQSADDSSLHIAAGTVLSGEADTGENLIFATDAGFSISPARIAFAATYQEGTLRAITGMDLPDEVRAARISLEPVPAQLGASPAIFLAIENVPDAHLSGHSFFFELHSDAVEIARALRNESWYICSAEGVFDGAGVLRPRRANAGVHSLEWLIKDSSAAGNDSANIEAPSLPDGFYAGKCFVMPRTPPARRALCRCPRAMEPAFNRMFGATQAFLSKERVWIRIAMPSEISNLHNALASITLHAMSCSNVECLNQTVYFAKHGTSIPVSREAGTARYLVAPLSIIGEYGSEYIPDFRPAFEPGAGRYSFQNGRIVLSPARARAGQIDSYANVRLWTTAGALGNSVGAGKVQRLAAPIAPGIDIKNLTSATGGTDEEQFADARARFAEAILSRDRLVTRADLANAVRAFDRRVLEADVEASLERGVSGLQRVQRVHLRLSQDDFVDPQTESRILLEDLKSYLNERFLYDMELALGVEWN